MKNELENLRPSSWTRLNTKGVFTTLNTYELIENLILFLFSRIYFMEYLISPFGVALFSALFFRKKRPYYVISSVLGVFSAASPVFFFKYVGSILIVMSIQLIFKNELKHKKRIVAIISAVAVFLNGGIYVLSEGFFAFDMLLLILESCTVFVSFFLFDKALLSAKRLLNSRSYDALDVLSVTTLFAIVTFSVSITENFWPIAHMGAIFVILLLSLTYGFGVSTPAGALFGFALSLSSAFPSQIICIYTLSSLFSGLLARYGRLVASGIFALSSLLTTLLLCPEANGILTVSYVAAACLLLFFVPERYFLQQVNTHLPRKESASINKVRTMADSQITSTIDSINSVGTIFHEVVDSFSDSRFDTNGAVFDTTKDAVCSKCSLFRFCWNKDKEKTLAATERMYSVLEAKGHLTKKDVPKEFSELCIRTDTFVCELNKNYESHKVTKMWAGKVLESKRLILEQFKNISMILNNLRKTISKKTDFIPDAERKIMAELSRRGISADKVTVYHNDGYSVIIDRLNCEGKDECDTVVANAISEVLEVPVVKEDTDCKSANCHIVFSEKTKLCADISASRTTKQNSGGSGDTAMFFPISPGKIAIVLADGMGSGEMANFQSNVAIELTKKLLLAGFDKETCVRLINDILMTNADKDTFSTIDLCVINLYTGEAEFIKTGSANSYLSLQKNFDTVCASSLPAGLVQEIDPDISSKYITAGDFLVMATDGITDVLDTEEGNKIFAILKDFDGTSQELSDMILAQALALSGGVACDDMTVVACKILRSA